jgi:3-dehydroquinate dehydratase-2
VKLAVVHGPNLNLLGTREPELYGTQTLIEINEIIAQLASELGIAVSFYQSNYEGALVEHIQSCSVHGILINAAAYTHTSIAIRDALISSAIPFVEVHMSNVFTRESFRHHSVLGDIALGIVTGFGANSYLLGLRGLFDHLRLNRENGL